MDQQNINVQNRDSLRTDESIVSRESEKIKKFFKALAVLVVFLSSLSMPLFLSYQAQEKAKELRIKMDMSQLKNWAEVFKIKNGNYFNLNNDSEVKRVLSDIKTMSEKVNIFVSSDAKDYCCQSKLTGKKSGEWCIDSSGYVGAKNNCSANNIKCK